MRSYPRVIAVAWSLTALAFAAVPPRDLLHPPAMGGSSRISAMQRVTLPVMVALIAGLAVPVVVVLGSPRARVRLARLDSTNIAGKVVVRRHRSRA